MSGDVLDDLLYESEGGDDDDSDDEMFCESDEVESTKVGRKKKSATKSGGEGKLLLFIY